MKERTKIGMILDESFPPDPRVMNECKLLINEGYQVFLFCLDYNGSQLTAEEIEGIQVRRIQLSKLMFKLSALAYTIPWYHLYLRKYIRNFVRENGIDIIHIHDMRVARSVFGDSQLSSLTTVLDLHENRPDIMRYYSHVNTLTGKLLINLKRWKKFEFKYIAAADRVIVVTEEAKDYYLSQIESDSSKFFVVPNSIQKGYSDFSGVDQEIIERCQSGFNLVYIGDTSKRRGLETVIDAVSQVVKTKADIKFLILGTSTFDSALREKVNRLDLNEHIIFLGWRDDIGMKTALSVSSVGVCPIYRNLHHDTTFANKLFQYMAFGLPLVVSDCNAQAKLTLENEIGEVYKDKDVAQLVEKIELLYTDSDLYQRYANNARKAINEKLNWEQVSCALLHLYKELT